MRVQGFLEQSGSVLPLGLVVAERVLGDPYEEDHTSQQQVRCCWLQQLRTDCYGKSMCGGVIIACKVRVYKGLVGAYWPSFFGAIWNKRLI